jgi:hypothetical protein
MEVRSLPPVELYRLGNIYYVLDGHHRVAAARLNGQLELDAQVVDFVPTARSSWAGPLTRTSPAPTPGGRPIGVAHC